MSPKAVPIIVGVGDIRNASKRVEDALEPIQLMQHAFDRALDGLGIPSTAKSRLRSSIDSIEVVATWTWPYPDLPNLVARRLGLNVTHSEESEQGGHAPGRALDEAARRIASGTSKAVLITGGESLASHAACAAAGKIPPPGWTKLDKASNPISPKTALLPPGISRTHQLGRPTQLYAMYEVALAAHRGQTFDESMRESAELYAEFAAIAERNPFAWNYGKPAKTAQEIGKVSEKNRMICLPYPLLLNAFNTVNLAAACILTSVEYAQTLGIPESKCVYVLGGAGTSDEEFLWDRPNFFSSPAVSRSIEAALEVANVKPEDLDLLDIYSCFPVVPKLAALQLGLPVVGSPKPLSLTGGMNSFGGAGNNYSMHAITEMTRQLQSGRGRTGLVLANGGYLSYEHAVVLSSQPRRDGHDYAGQNPLPKLLPSKRPAVAGVAEGKATIETYTVEFERDGSPGLAFIIGVLNDTGLRFVANHGSSATLTALASTADPHVGRQGYVRPDPQAEGRNIFTFEEPTGPRQGHLTSHL